MKRRIKIVALALTTFLSTLGYAKPSSSVEMKVVSAGTFALILNDISSDVQIQLKDINGYILHEENIAHIEKYSKLYDISALPDGKYEFEIESATKTEILPIEILNNKVVVDREKTTEYFKPAVYQKNTSITVSLLTMNKKKLRISLFNSENELIHTEELKGGQYLGKKYNLSKIPEGKYLLALTSEGRTYYHDIMVD